MVIHESITAPENWKTARFTVRKFVKYPAAGQTDAEYLRIIRSKNDVKLTVIVPTVDAFRGGYFEELLDQIHYQRFTGFEIIVIRGDSRQGRAINIGADLAQGEYLLTLDDDTSLSDIETFSKLVAIMDNNPDIGIAGGNNIIPENASSFIRRAMKEIPRRSWKPVQVITESDFAEHPCMIMRLKEFKAVGGENELIPRGLDPYLRNCYRQARKRVVIVPEVIYHHLPPASLKDLLWQFYRNGFQASYAKRHYPQWIIETPNHHGSFRPHASFAVRLFRFPVRLAKALITGKFIWFLSEVAYAAGYIKNILSEKPLKAALRNKSA